MEYNDEGLLSPKGYQQMAEAYAKEIRSKGFIFMRLDNSKEEAYLHEVANLLWQIKNLLTILGGFLGTGALYNLNEKHILKLQALYNPNFEIPIKSFSHDKIKCFLSLLSLESNLINKLLSLAEQSDFSREILAIIKERTLLTSSLFKANSIIS